MNSKSSDVYQLIIEYPTSLADSKQKEDLKAVEEQLSISGASVTFEDWGEKKLAYEIEKNDMARFWIGEVKSGDSKLKWNDFRTYLNRNKSVIRYLILKNRN